MNQLLTSLESLGCDIEGATQRMMGDEDFLEECIRMTAMDPGFAALEQAVAARDPHEAFAAAHSLKGVLGNTGLTPLYTLATAIVEPLRHGEFAADTEALCHALSEEQKKLITLLEKGSVRTAEEKE